VRVSALSAIVKRDPLDTAFRYSPPTPAVFGHRPDYDENYVGVQLRHQQEGDLDVVLNMLISKESARKLNLMVGDAISMKLTKN